MLVRTKGKIDAFVRHRDDGTLIALDFKTSCHLPIPEDLATKPSSTVYTCLAKRQYPSATIIEVSQLSTASGMSVSVALTRPELELGRNNIHAMVTSLHQSKALGSSAFESRPGEHCAWCDFQNSCPIFATADEGEEEFIL
jgi:hypothetical protein